MNRRHHVSLGAAVLTVVACLAPSSARAQTIYGIDDTSLYTVDVVTGDATLIGPLHPLPSGLLGGLEWADGTLYGLAGTPGNALWRVDPATAECTFIGNLNSGGSIFEGGLAWDGEAMWGVNEGVINNAKRLVRINLDTGKGTVIGTLGDYDFNGLAYHDGVLYGINDRVGTNHNDALWVIDRDRPSSSFQAGGPFGFDLGVKGGMAGEFCFADGPRNGNGPFYIFQVDFATGAANILSQPTVRFRSLAPVLDKYRLEVGPLIAGELAEFVFTKATPGQRQFLAYSVRGLGETFVPQLNVTLDIRAPKLGGVGRADASGTAMITKRVPKGSSGVDAWMQGCELNRATNVVEKTIQ